MIQIKISQIQEAAPIINDLMTQKLAVIAAFKLNLIVQELQAVVNSYESERNEILKNSVKRDEQGNPVLAIDDKKNVIPGKYVVELSPENANKLKELEDRQYPVKLVDLSLAELADAKIQASEIKHIAFIFVESRRA